MENLNLQSILSFAVQLSTHPLCRPLAERRYHPHRPGCCHWWYLLVGPERSNSSQRRCFRTCFRSVNNVWGSWAKKKKKKREDGDLMPGKA